MSTTQNIINGLTSMSNAEIFNAVRNFDKNFAKITAQKTSEGFTEESMNPLNEMPQNILNEFTALSLKMVLNLVSQSYVKSILVDSGIIQSYSEEFGGYINRITIDSVINPISPKFLEFDNAENGTSIDPFTIRKIKLFKERFWKLSNFSYQNLVSVREYEIRKVLSGPYGLGQMLGSFASAIAESFKLQQDVVINECINNAIHSTLYPMKSTQKVEIEVDDVNNLSNEDLANIVRSVYDIKTSTEISNVLDVYNAYGFKSGVNFDDFVLLVKPQIMTDLQFNVNTFGILNGKTISFPEKLKTVMVKDFGGLEAYKEADYTTKLNVKYGEKFGDVIGYYDPAAPDTIIPEADVYWKDPNENIVACLIQRGCIFSVQAANQSYSVTSIYNPLGKYYNLISSLPEFGYFYDPAFNLITISVKNKTPEQV